MTTKVDQRETYRVSFDQDQHDVLARINVGGDSFISVRPLDMNARGIAIEIPKLGRPAVAMGSELIIELTSSLRGLTVTLHGVLISDFNRMSGNSRRWGVRFRDPEMFLKQWGGEIQSILNRRVSVRVPPSIVNPTSVSIRHNGEVHTASVLDISRSGIGAIVPMCADLKFADADSLDLEVNLPPPFDRVRITGIVIRRQLHLKGVRYGMEYDLAGIDQGSSHDPRMDIVKYVMARQREINRSRSRAEC